jgi:hypothetical protein
MIRVQCVDKHGARPGLINPYSIAAVMPIPEAERITNQPELALWLNCNLPPGSVMRILGTLKEFEEKIDCFDKLTLAIK